MLTVQYTGDKERTVGVWVVYPGELLRATQSMLAAWRVEHGDVFAVVGETGAPADEGGVVVDAAGGAHVFADLADADAKTGKRGRGK